MLPAAGLLVTKPDKQDMENPPSADHVRNRKPFVFHMYRYVYIYMICIYLFHIPYLYTICTYHVLSISIYLRLLQGFLNFYQQVDSIGRDDLA